MAIAAATGGHAYALDVRDADEVTEVVGTVAQTLGQIDILVNNAGTGDLRPMHTVDDKLWHRLIDVNLTGTFNATRAVIPYMLESGSGAIVNNASVSGLAATRNEAAYSAAKGGIIGLTLPLARDLSAIGVRVMTIAPGTFRTPAYAMMPDEMVDHLESLTPFPKRMGHPDEYAALVEHICANTMLNGEVIRIDGAVRFGPK